MAQLVGSKATLEELTYILKQMRDESGRSMEDFTIPAWPYMVADRMGYQRAIDDVLRLIDLKGE
jgi:hypothetical protein